MSQTERASANIDIEHGYMTVHDWESDSTLTRTILDLFREVEEIDLEGDDEDILYEVVDLESLDELFRSDQQDMSFTFVYQDCKVLIKGNGRILVHPPISPSA